MRRSLALLAALWFAGSARSSEPESPPPDLAARAWAVTEVILDRHVDPPARQQMILAGLRVLHSRVAKAPPPAGLARRVSEANTPEALAALFSAVWPRTAPTQKGESFEDIFFEGLGAAVPGGLELIPAKELKVLEQFEGNTYVGIQVALGLDEKAGRPAFHEILAGGPAEHAGAKKGDLIDAVDGASTEGLGLREVIDRLRGEEGTDVLVRFRRPSSGEVFEVPMRRSRLPRKTVRGLSPLPDGGWDVRLDGASPIGYLKVTEIVGSTPQELRTFANQLESEGLRALVLDLREANHANLHPTILLADALLDGGTIGRIREGDSSREIKAEPDALFRGWPMVVLVGGKVSNEVAWLCAGLQDNHRATILGEPAVEPVGTSVQSIVPLPGGEWSLRLTTGRLERGDGSPLSSRTNRRRGEGPDEGLLQLAKELNQGGYDPRQVTRMETESAGRGAPPPQEDPLPKARALLEDALKLLSQ